MPAAASQQASRKRALGHVVGGRRSGLAKPLSFDEAAAPVALAPTEAGLTSCRRGRDRERQRQARNLDARSKTPRLGGRCPGWPSIKGPSGPARAWRFGKPGSIGVFAEAGPSSSNEASLDSRPPPRLRPKRGSWKLCCPAKAARRGDSRIARSAGCTCRHVGCKSRLDASSPPGHRASVALGVA